MHVHPPSGNPARLLVQNHSGKTFRVSLQRRPCTGTHLHLLLLLQLLLLLLLLLLHQLPVGQRYLLGQVVQLWRVEQQLAGPPCPDPERTRRTPVQVPQAGLRWGG